MGYWGDLKDDDEGMAPRTAAPRYAPPVQGDFFRDVLEALPRQRFECTLQIAVRVVRWHARSSAFVHDVIVWAQWPQLCYEIGPAVVDFNGPDDLQLLAIVEPIKGGRPGELMPVVFTRRAQTGGG